MWGTLISILVILFIAYWVVGVILYIMQPKFLYSPVRDIPYTPADVGLDYEEVTFRTADRLVLHGWFVPAANAQLTVLYCHGNGGNMMYFLDTVNFLNKLGLNCFVFDYRGYGNSEGTPSEQGTYLDARAAYRWLTKKKKVSADAVIIFGWSLGGCIAAYLAGKVRAAGLVIESAFTSYVDAGRKFYPYMPVRWFASFRYPTIEYVRKVKCPILIIHSRNDEMLPFEFGLELYEAANEPKEFVEIFGNHNDGFLVSGETYRNAWLKLVRSLNRPADNTQVAANDS